MTNRPSRAAASGATSSDDASGTVVEVDQARHAPVALASGSYDYDVLREGLDAAVKAKPEDREAAVVTAIEASVTRLHDPVDSRAQPGYVMQDVENEALGVRENIQVFDADAAAAIPEADGAIPSAGTSNGAADDGQGPQE